MRPQHSFRRAGATAAAPDVRGGRLPFWTDPIFVVSTIIGVSLLMFAIISDKVFLSEFRQPRQPVDDVFLTYGLIWMAVLTGFVVGRTLVPQTPWFTAEGEKLFAQRLERQLRFTAYVAVVMTCIGYAIYVGTSKASPAMFIAALQGEVRANFILKDSFEKVPGVTSFMNLACWWFVYVGFRAVVQRRKLTVIEISISLALLAATVVRGFAVNERRVIFELMVPAAIACVFWRRHWPPMVSAVLWIGPLLAPLLLCGVFMATEYFRSWTNFWQFGMTELSYPEWALTRLAGYYVTALNNGMAALSDADLHTYGTLTFSGLSKLPFVADLVWPVDERVSAIADYKAVISRLANEEFNNPGGASVVLIDFGYFAGAVVLFFTGLFISMTYRMAQRGGLVAVLLYSQVFFSMLEITRFWNFLSSFSVINLFFLTFLALLFFLGGQSETAPCPGGRGRRRGWPALARQTA